MAVQASAFKEVAWPHEFRRPYDQTVPGPPFFALAQIPYRWTVPSTYQTKGFRRHLGTLLVFHSGNIQAPNAVDDGAVLETFLGAKEFRGALAVDQAQLELFQGVPVGLRFRGLSRVGYTAPPIPPATRRRSFGYSLGETFSEAAEDNWECGELSDRTGLYLANTMRFRVGQPARAASRYLMGFDAPFVTMSLRYELRINASAEVYIAGSAVPSVHYYWRHHAGSLSLTHNRHHDMTTIESGLWTSFLEAGSDIPPVAALKQRWTDVLR